MKEDREAKKVAEAVTNKRMTEGRLKSELKKEYGSMPPGTPLASRGKIHEALGGADRTIKRAIESLTAEGFFFLNTKNQFIVSGKGLLDSHAPSSIEEFLEFRLLIEPVVAEVAAQAFKLRPDTFDTQAKTAFKAAYDALPDPLVEKGVEGDLRTDRAFHNAMHALSTNQMLAFVLKCIDHFFDENIANVVSRLYGVGSYRRDTHDQHLLIAEEIFAGRPEQARAATRAHLTYAHEAIRKQLRGDGR
jgi:GntR family transcriptional regulator, transcriptional repressor for pyruvate dehydrogenase complex